MFIASLCFEFRAKICLTLFIAGLYISYYYCFGMTIVILCIDLYAICFVLRCFVS